MLLQLWFMKLRRMLSNETGSIFLKSPNLIVFGMTLRGYEYPSPPLPNLPKYFLDSWGKTHHLCLISSPSMFNSFLFMSPKYFLPVSGFL